MGEYSFLFTQVWAPESTIKAQIFDENQALQPMYLQFIDMPYIFTNTQDGFDFIYALTECRDIELFGLKSV